MKITRDPGINWENYIFERPEDFQTFFKLVGEGVPEPDDAERRSVRLHRTRHSDLIDKIGKLANFKQVDISSPVAVAEFTDSDEDGKPEKVTIKEEDTEVSDERCKDIRKKRIDKFKGNWGETDEMKRQKKSKTAKADNDDKETVDVSGIAAAIRRGPGSAYEV